MSEQVRPTKKQQELLSYVQEFIATHGYGPSYREIMVGCSYTSPATVAVHVNNLVARGHLRKNGRSARSIEVINPTEPVNTAIHTNTPKPSEEKWLVQHIERRFCDAESGHVTQDDVDNLYVLVGALRVLNLEGAAQSFIPRLSSIKQRARVE